VNSERISSTHAGASLTPGNMSSARDSCEHAATSIRWSSRRLASLWLRHMYRSIQHCSEEQGGRYEDRGQHKPDARAVHENSVAKVYQRKHNLGGQEYGVSETRDEHNCANQWVSCDDAQPIPHHGYLGSSEKKIINSKTSLQRMGILWRGVVEVYNARTRRVFDCMPQRPAQAPRRRRAG
jgi:hypothetical protein